MYPYFNLHALIRDLINTKRRSCFEIGGQPIVIENLEDLMEDSYFVEFIRVVLDTTLCSAQCVNFVFNIKIIRSTRRWESTVPPNIQVCEKNSVDLHYCKE
jgi:hypothetical protein